MASFINPNLPDYLQPVTAAQQLSIMSKGASEGAQAFQTSFLGQQRINEERRQNNQQAALLPLKTKIMELELHDKAFQTDMAIKSQDGLAEAQRIVSEAYDNGKAADDGTMSSLLGLGSRYPALPMNPQYQKLIGLVGASKRMEETQSRFDTTIKLKESALLSAEERARLALESNSAIQAAHDKTKLDMANMVEQGKRDRASAGVDRLTLQRDAMLRLARANQLHKDKISEFQRRSQAILGSKEAKETEAGAVKAQGQVRTLAATLLGKDYWLESQPATDTNAPAPSTPVRKFNLESGKLEE